jgi:hypothetical protein
MTTTNPTELAPESDPLHWVDPPVLMYRPMYRPCISSYIPSLCTALYTVHDPLHWVDPPILVHHLIYRPCISSYIPSLCTALYTVHDPLHWVDPPILIYRLIYHPCILSYIPSPIQSPVSSSRENYKENDNQRLPHDTVRDPLHWVNHDSPSPLVWPIINHHR